MPTPTELLADIRTALGNMPERLSAALSEKSAEPKDIVSLQPPALPEPQKTESVVEGTRPAEPQPLPETARMPLPMADERPGQQPARQEVPMSFPLPQEPPPILPTVNEEGPIPVPVVAPAMVPITEMPSPEPSPMPSPVIAPQGLAPEEGMAGATRALSQTVSAETGQWQEVVLALSDISDKLDELIQVQRQQQTNQQESIAPPQMPRSQRWEELSPPSRPRFNAAPSFGREAED